MDIGPEPEQPPAIVRRLDMVAATSHLSNGLPDWREVSVVASAYRPGRWSASVGLEHTERFDAADNYAFVRLEARSVGVGGFYVLAGGAPDADHRARSSVTVGGDRTLGDRARLLIDATTADHAVGRVLTVSPGLALGDEDVSAQLTLRWLNVWDENDDHRMGWLVSGSVPIGGRARLHAALSDAPETSEGATVDVASATVGIRYQASDSFAIRLNFVHEDRAAYDRDEVSVSFGRRF